MFEDSLIESGNKLKTKRGLTTSLTFVLEIILVGVMVLIPLLFTEALPKAQLLTGLVAPPPPPPPPPPPAAVIKVVKIETNMINDQLRTPTKIPKKIEIVKEEEAPPQMAGVVGGVPGGVPGGSMNGVIGGIVSSAAVVPTIHQAQRVRVSQGVTSGLLIRRIQPSYPPLAKQARISGSVILQAEISKDGSIQNLHVISGHPMLVPSALEAVKQWKYKPYILNGEPVEVETTITVNFTLAG